MKKNAHVYLLFALALLLLNVACGTIPVVERAAVPVSAGTAVVLLIGGAPALVVSAGAAFVAWVATVLVESSNAPPAPGAPALPWYLHPGYWALIYVVIRNRVYLLNLLKTLPTGGLKAALLNLAAIPLGGKVSKAAETATLTHAATRREKAKRRVQPPVLNSIDSTTTPH